jgi:hypothetical protein
MIWYGCYDQEAKTTRFPGPQGMADTYHALALHSKFISDVLMLNLLQLLYCRRGRWTTLANFTTRILQSSLAIAPMVITDYWCMISYLKEVLRIICSDACFYSTFFLLCNHGSYVKFTSSSMFSAVLGGSTRLS